jgi:hypothetical protein
MNEDEALERIKIRKIREMFKSKALKEGPETS